MERRRRSYPETVPPIWRGIILSWAFSRHRSYVGYKNNSIYLSADQLDKTYSEYFSYDEGNNGNFSSGNEITIVDIIQLGTNLLVFFSQHLFSGYLSCRVVGIPLEEIVSGTVSRGLEKYNVICSYSYYVDDTSTQLGSNTSSFCYSRFFYVENKSKVVCMFGHINSESNYVINSDLTATLLSGTYNYGVDHYEFKGSIVNLGYSAGIYDRITYNSSYSNPSSYSTIYHNFDQVTVTPKYLVGVNTTYTTSGSKYDLGLEFYISSTITGINFSSTKFSIPKIITVSSNLINISKAIKTINKAEYNPNSGRFTFRTYSYSNNTSSISNLSELSYVIEIEGDFDTGEINYYVYKTTYPIQYSRGFNNGPYEVIGDGNVTISSSNAYYARVVDIKNNKIIKTVNTSGNYFLLTNGGCIVLN